MKRCERCQHGIASIDGEGGRFVVCALLPPTPILVINKIEIAQVVNNLTWHRPMMALHGFCGQFKLSWWKLLSRGART